MYACIGSTASVICLFLVCWLTGTRLTQCRSHKVSYFKHLCAEEICVKLKITKFNLLHAPGTGDFIYGTHLVNK